MPGKIDARLKELGITLPPAPPPAANYLPFVVSGSLIFVSGQIPIGPKGLEFSGKVGADLGEEDAAAAVCLCAINLIAQARAACDGDLDRITRVIKLGGFINCTDDYSAQPALLNTASDLMVAVFGEAGKHSRFAVGSNALPLGVPVEIDGIFEFS